MEGDMQKEQQFIFQLSFEYVFSYFEWISCSSRYIQKKKRFQLIRRVNSQEIYIIMKNILKRGRV